MNRTLVAGACLGLSAALLGPLTHAVGEESGRHPVRRHDTNAVVDHRRAAFANFDGWDEHGSTTLRLNVFDHQEIYAGASEDGAEAARFRMGRVTASIERCEHVGVEFYCTSQTWQVAVSPRSRNTYANVDASNAGFLDAVIPQADGTSCKLLVVWQPRPLTFDRETHSFVTTITSSEADVRITGSCAERLNLSGTGWGLLWSSDAFDCIAAPKPEVCFKT